MWINVILPALSAHYSFKSCFPGHQLSQRKSPAFSSPASLADWSCTSTVWSVSFTTWISLCRDCASFIKEYSIGDWQSLFSFQVIKYILVLLFTTDGHGYLIVASTSSKLFGLNINTFLTLASKRKMQANSSSQVALFSSLKKGGDGGYCLDTAVMGKKGRKETILCIMEAAAVGVSSSWMEGRILCQRHSPGEGNRSSLKQTQVTTACVALVSSTTCAMQGGVGI